MQPAGSTGVPANGVVSAASPDEIRAHVARILASPAFRASKRCHRFVDFVINQFLAGNTAGIKERTLATEVFDRSASWDSGGDDTIVRVGAREVRKRLAQFYNSAEGMQEKIRIELPLGSYVPEIVRLDYPVPVPAAPIPAVVTIEGPRARPSARPARRIRGIALAIATAFFVAATYATVHKPALADQFWAPYFHSSEPTLIAVASPLVYSPTARAYRLNDLRWGAPALPEVRPLRLEPNQLNGADFVPVSDYLAFGDAVASTSMQVLLAKHSREAHVRFASRVEFAEFRDAPVILVGAFTNHWTIEFTQHLRYHFGYDPHWIPSIVDTAKPSQSWSIPQKQDNGSSPEDYFLVCRLPTSPSGTSMLIAGGLEQFGTEAAGRFLSDPARLNAVLKGFGPDWQSKNLEFIMHAKVIGNSPAAPELVASYTW
jgi:hypothetical protein